MHLIISSEGTLFIIIDTTDDYKVVGYYIKVKDCLKKGKFLMRRNKLKTIYE